MRKALVLVLVLVFSLFLASSAFAHDTGSIVFYGNSYSGSVSYGQHGHSWYSGDGKPVIVKGVFGQARDVNGHWEYYYGQHGKKHYYFVPDPESTVLPPESISQPDEDYPDYDGDGQWEFYKDAAGVLHYFYVDPDVEGEYRWYRDEDGVTQYEYVVTGWKLN